MLLEHVQQNLAKREIEFEVRAGASADDLAQAELRIGSPLPAEPRRFYESMNGLSVRHPALEILPVHKLKLRGEVRVPFAVLDRVRVMEFDIASLNDAEQWSICDADSGYVVTLTMASFWGNKIFKWIDRRAPIWQSDFWKPGHAV